MAGRRFRGTHSRHKGKSATLEHNLLAPLLEEMQGISLRCCNHNDWLLQDSISRLVYPPLLGVRDHASALRLLLRQVLLLDGPQQLQARPQELKEVLHSAGMAVGNTDSRYYGSDKYLQTKPTASATDEDAWPTRRGFRKHPAQCLLPADSSPLMHQTRSVEREMHGDAWLVKTVPTATAGAKLTTCA